MLARRSANAGISYPGWWPDDSFTAAAERFCRLDGVVLAPEARPRFGVRALRFEPLAG